MEEYNRNCLMINDSIDKLVNEFALKYYGKDAHIIRIDRAIDCLHYNLQINDDFRNIDEIYTALWFDIQEKVLFDYKEYALDKGLKGEKYENIKNFYLMKKNGQKTLSNGL